MEEQSPQILEYAELLLGEEKKHEARLLLTAYLKRMPESADAWMLMSQAVETEQQELDCLKRVLKYAPSYEPARQRVKELETSLAQESALPAGASTAPDAQQVPQVKPPPAAEKKPSASAPPFTPPVSPFVFSEEAGAKAEEPFDLFAPGAFADLASAPLPSTPAAEQPASTPPAEAAPAPTFPEKEKEEVPEWALPPEEQKAPPEVKPPAPKKKRTWVVDVVIIGIVLCLVLAVVSYFALSDYARTFVNNLQSTQETGALLTSRPPNTLEPTWTASATFTLPPPTETPLPPTATETPLFTPENTPIPPGAVGLNVGMFPPDFTLTELVSGEQFTLSETRGQPVLLFFFTTWCPYCAREVGDLQNLYEVFQEQGWILVGINEGEPTEDVDAYRQMHGITFPLLLDSDRAVSTLYKATSIPHHVFIGLTGKNMYVVTGQLSADDLENKIRATMRIFPTVTP